MRSILEVWDYRLSTAQPINYRGMMPTKNGEGKWELVEHPTWVAAVYPQDERAEPLELHDTGVAVVKGDMHDGAGLDACFAFYRSVRDKYSREEIEELKPKVAVIRADDKIRQKANRAYQAVLDEEKAKQESAS